MADEDKILKLEQLTKYNTDLKAVLRWSGTRAQYDAIATKNPYTTYYITDENAIYRGGKPYGGGAMDDDWSTTSKNGLQNLIITDAMLHAYGDGVGTIHPEHQKAIRSGSGTPTGSETGDIYLLQKDGQLLTESEIVNDLTTGGALKVLSAEMGKSLEDNKVDKDGDKTLSTITLNGTVTQTPTFYAPIEAGTNKQLVEWDGTNNVPIFTSTPTITNITATTNVGMRRDVTDDRLAFYGGTMYNTGAYLRLDGMTGPNTGGFDICAHNGSSYSILTGRPDGTLTWGGVKVATEKASYLNFTLPNGIWVNIKKIGRVCTLGVYGTTTTTTQYDYDLPVGFRLAGGLGHGDQCGLALDDWGRGDDKRLIWVDGLYFHFGMARTGVSATGTDFRGIIVYFSDS